MADVVEITGAAADANPAVAEYCEEVGERVRFESKTDADALVEKLNDEGTGTVRLRSVHEDHPLEEGRRPRRLRGSDLILSAPAVGRS